MTYLLAALAALALGPVLYGLLHGHDRAVRFVDGFVYIAVPALVAWQVLPFALEQRSAWPVVLLGGGLAIPWLIERASHGLGERTDDVAIVVGMTGLVLHTLLEGAAFAPGDEAIGLAFAVAVVLHRVPVGLIVWWLVRPRHGRGAATAAVGLLMGATLAGWVAGTALLAGGGHAPAAELYQAFVSGSLVHVVFHQGRHDHRECHHG